MTRKHPPCICKHGYLTHGLDGACGADWCACRGYRPARKKKARKP